MWVGFGDSEFSEIAGSSGAARIGTGFGRLSSLGVVVEFLLFLKIKISLLHENWSIKNLFHSAIYLYG